MKLCYPKCAQWRFWANCIYKISTTYILKRNSNKKKKVSVFFSEEVTGYSVLEFIHMCTSAVSRCPGMLWASLYHYEAEVVKWAAMLEIHNFGHVPSVKIQVSLHIPAVWSESSLGTFWLAKDAKFLHGDNRDCHGFNPRRGRQHSFVEIDHEIFSTVILTLPLIQEGQLSVSGKRMCTILVNRLED